MKILKLGLILLFVSALSGTSLSLVYIKTKDRIAAVKTEKIYTLQKEILPDAHSFEDTGDGSAKAGYDESGKEVGTIVTVTPKGYAGKIEMLVGISPEHKVTAVKIVRQTETPGLGAQINKKGFLDQFQWRELKDLVLKKDAKKGAVDGTTSASLKGIEAITGATISSRAVVKGIAEALEHSVQKEEESK